MSTRDCTDEFRRGRLKKAQQFFEAGVVIEDELPDAAVSTFVLSGVASSDVICCARLGIHAKGGDHLEAVPLLAKADPEAAKYLNVLLRVKHKAAYTHQSPNSEERKKSRRAAEALLEAARREDSH